MPHQFHAFDQIRVDSPCTQDWEEMIGNDKLRFCSHCQLTVNNINEMSVKDVRRLFATTKGRVCVRYHQSVISSPPPPLALPPLHQIIGRRASRIAAGAFTAALSLSAAMQQVNGSQSTGAISASAVQGTTRANTFFTVTSSLVGSVLNAAGTPIDGAIIVLSNPEKNLVFSTSSDSEGRFKFEFLDPGSYDLLIQAPGHMATEEKGIYIGANVEQRLDRTLQAESLPSDEGPQDTKLSESITVGSAAIAFAEDPLVRAAQQDDIEKVQEALLNGAKINTRDKLTDATALEFAVRNGNLEMLQLLIASGADPNSSSSKGQTALMLIGDQATRDIVSVLLTAGAKVTARDNDGDTALAEAAAYNDSDVVKALIDSGAQMNVQNKAGQTALMRAAERNLVNNVRLLMHAGADFNLRDKEGKTAMTYAREQGNSQVIRLISSYGAAEGQAKKE